MSYNVHLVGELVSLDVKYTKTTSQYSFIDKQLKLCNFLNEKESLDERMVTSRKRTGVQKL